MEIPRGSQPGPQKQHLSRQYTAGTLSSDPVTEVVPPSLSIITPILHVANEIERENRRVAWMCRFHALQKVHRLDPRSSGRGVRQFKTLLLKRLQLEDEEMMALRKQSSDPREMEVFFLSYYENYVKAYDGVDQTDRAHLAKACQTASVLGEALCAVSKNVPPEVMELIKDVNEKKAKYMAYNILPLDEAGVSHAIMKFAEIKAAVAALRDTDELPGWSSVEESSISESDVLDFLQALFGFQKDNVANQREHLLLLLANAYIHLKQKTDMSELSERALDLIMDQLLENYKKWCKFLGCPDNLSSPQYGQKTHQWKVICMGLYLLIWGEAANLRFMPECLCYIYYHMLRDLSKALSPSSGNTSENFLPAYNVGEGSFLRNIVMPIYKVIEQETQRSKSGTAPHSSWRNYDDLNEHFWSVDCLGWGLPIKGDGEFHKLTTEKKNSSQNPATRLHWDARKNNFVEIRTFWHLFRSFDRMWTFYILALQAMIILAWNTKDLFTDVFQISVFEKVLSIFITSAILHLLQVILDLLMNLKSYKSKKIRNILRHSLKFLVAVGWVIVLPVCYVQSWENPTGLAKIMRNWFRQSGNDPSLYITAVVIYLLPNFLAMVLFFLPFLGRWMENSEFQMIRVFCWWLQPRLYVGRDMHAGAFTLFKYTIFWVVLLSSKLLFSYYIQIKPLVQSTQKILQITDVQYRWHEMFPSGHKTLGAIISIWAPVILVYFMDTQIWYSIFSTIVGGIIGAFRRLGEIRTLGMLRSRFQSLPVAFTDHLFPPEQKKSKQDDASTKNSYAKFAQLWNEMIKSFREEDLINNRELDLMIVPEICDLSANLIRWPSFLLASKIPIALGMAAAFKGKDQDLWKRISGVAYMKDAVLECYASFQRVLSELVIGDIEKGVIDRISKLMDTYIGDKTLFENVRMSALPELNKKFIELLEILEKNEESSRDSVIFVLQDMLEVVTGDFLMDWKWDLTSQTGNTRQEPSHGVGDPSHTPQWTKQLFANIEPPSLKYPLPESHAWNEEIKRLHLLLTVQETAMDVPSNLEARRRIAFFTNSLFMDIPNPPCVRNMISFSVLTPYFNEETSFSNTDIYKENEDGVSVLFYLKKIFPDEWDNFLERLQCKKEAEVWKHEDLWSDENNVLELRHWVSQRGQTLSRTVRGMMYNRRALKLQAFLDMASEEGFVLQSHALEEEISKRLVSETLDAVVDMKFSYVVTCQNYGLEKQQGDRRAIDIFNLMVNYPSLRVAYIDTVEEREKDKVKREYYSVLVKAMNGLEQVIYRIKLPGPVMLGEGKPENQNHAIIFTRGEALQTIDMDQDNYLEEAFKMRNLLQEFKKEHGAIKPTILGLREHIFTGSVSSLAWFMFNQETSVVTIEQRVLANPLRVRFHYGHPDVFDRLFHITRGGIGKASRVINLSDDIFAGMNSILRGGNVTHHEYIQVGKGRDVGLNQISMFEAKVATGYGEQALSRDIYRLGHRLDFFRMLSCYFTTVGYYFNTMIVVLTAYVFLYGRIYLALSGLGESLNNQAELENNIPLEAALASQSLVQVGLLMSLPMVMEIGLERGFHSALSDFIVMQLQLASVFFTFSLGTKTHYFGRTILHGGTKYRPTVRGFVVRHDRFAEIYRLYSRSHFTKGLELMILLLVYNLFGPPAAQGGQIPYILVGFSMWFLVATWLFAPFLFNPSGFEWQKIVDDWEDWIKWMNNRGGIGVVPNKSWESWWDEEQEHLKHTGLLGRSIQSLLAFRFFLYQYGLVYHLSISNGSTSISVYGFSWLIILGLLTLLKVASMGRQRFSADFQLLFRLLKAFIFVGCISSLIVLFIFSSLTLGDVFTSILAFMPTAWALLQIAQACRPVMMRIGIWESTKALARGYEYIMGLIVFTPVAILAWFPFVSEFQTRLLFNQAFSRGLQISRILAGGKKGQN